MKTAVLPEGTRATLKNLNPQVGKRRGTKERLLKGENKCYIIYAYHKTCE